MEIVGFALVIFYTLLFGIAIGMAVQNVWLHKNGMLKEDRYPRKPWWWPWK